MWSPLLSYLVYEGIYSKMRKKWKAVMSGHGY